MKHTLLRGRLQVRILPGSPKLPEKYRLPKPRGAVSLPASDIVPCVVTTLVGQLGRPRADAGRC